jgi:hypothetical protein
VFSINLDAFDLATELLRRNIPFLFYTSWGDMELIPDRLREMPLLEKPTHFVLVAKLLSRMIKRGQVLEGEAGEDSDWSNISDPPLRVADHQSRRDAQRQTDESFLRDG